MKNVTLTMSDDLVRRARVAAAAREKSLSKFVSELVEREVGPGGKQLEAIEPFLSGPGFPGISRNWRGREDLYAEREDELLRRYERSRLRSRPQRTGKARGSGKSSQAGDEKPNASSKRAKPE
jgi:hypothetical protein